MATRLRHNGRNIAVSGTNGYTVEKVAKAIEFVKHATRRGTKFEDYLNMYNYLRDTNEVLPNCKVCGAAKYIAAVENYAKYGYLTLINQGVDPDLLNGKKKQDEGSDRGNDVSDNGASEGVETEVKAVESQETTQGVHENGEGEAVFADGDAVVYAKEDTTEGEENVSVDANQTKNKRRNKKG